jgi:hypothetical protein
VLRNRTLQLRIVKENPNNGNPPRYGIPPKPIDIPVEQVRKVVDETLVKVALTVIAISAATTALATVKEIAIITAEAKIK